MPLYDATRTRASCARAQPVLLAGGYQRITQGFCRAGPDKSVDTSQKPRIFPFALLAQILNSVPCCRCGSVNIGPEGLRKMQRETEFVVSGTVFYNFVPTAAAAEEVPLVQGRCICGPREVSDVLARHGACSFQVRDMGPPGMCEVRVMTSYRPRLLRAGTAAARIRNDGLVCLGGQGHGRAREVAIGEREVFWGYSGSICRHRSDLRQIFRVKLEPYADIKETPDAVCADLTLGSGQTWDTTIVPSLTLCLGIACSYSTTRIRTPSDRRPLVM